ncbi:hypothetical protein LX32DRAFT_658002 [Colletotrichum zoysiae]|uniref:Uncharacterized protein n=1 Tax=Colletotrichum zoysiae TaxID=1216348 RepID=A0AAD9LU17_9PEZI|nr:hypothetical protein LX32DRAFT_658002 [Colletotrichum zoysiae]
MKFNVISLAITLTSALVAANPIGPDGLLPRDAACDAKCAQRCTTRVRRPQSEVLRERRHRQLRLRHPGRPLGLDALAGGVAPEPVLQAPMRPTVRQSHGKQGVLELRCEAKGAVDSCICGTEGNPSGPSRRAA